MQYWFSLACVAVVFLIFRRVVPPGVLRFSAIFFQVAFTVLAVGLAAFGGWCLTGVRSSSEMWALPLIGFYFIMAAALFVFGPLMARHLRKAASERSQPT